MSSILLIQADADARAHINQIIVTEPSLAIYSAVGSIVNAHAVIAHRVPDLIVADLRLPDGTLAELLDALRPNRSRVLVLTNSLHDPHLMHALRHGADGYLLAGRPPQALLEMIRLVLAGESQMSPEVARRVRAHFNALNSPLADELAREPMPLSESQQRLLQWISDGYLTPDIARGFSITTQQVGLLTRSVYRCLQLDSQSRQ